MSETHDAYGSRQSLSTEYIEVHRHETGPGMAKPHPHSTPKHIRLNYIFVRHSAGTAPSPLPLVVSQALIEVPAADLRPILMEKLEAEGVVLELGDIRFWRTRKPLNLSQIFNDPNVWIQKGGVKRKKFEVIPFTESLVSSLGERVQDEKLLHLIVTGGEAPSILEPASPDLSTLIIPASQAIAIGRYDVWYNTLERKSCVDVREGERHSQDISIPWQAESSPESLQKHAAQTPTIILGICFLDTGNYSGDDLQLLSYISDAHQDGFRAHFDSFGKTFLYSAYLSWMAITPSHPAAGDSIQCGTSDSQSSLSPRKLGRRYTTQRVLFRKPYERTPNVFSCLAGLNIGGPGSRHWDIRTFVTSVDREGFTLHIEKIRDSEVDVNQVVAHAQTSWVAFPSGGTADRKMACGEFHLGDGERTEETEGQVVMWRGRSAFAERFASPPQVLSAFTRFDLDRSHNVRLRLKIDNVSQEGMEWHVMTWGGTVVYGATFAYLAVGAP